MKYTLPKGIVQACAGIVSDCRTEPYVSAIRAAESVIGQDYPATPEAQRNRGYLICMVKENLVNRKKNDRESLNRRYGMMVSHNTLHREKRKFCYQLAKNLRLI